MVELFQPPSTVDEYRQSAMELMAERGARNQQVAQSRMLGLAAFEGTITRASGAVWEPSTINFTHVTVYTGTMRNRLRRSITDYHALGLAVCASPLHSSFGRPIYYGGEVDLLTGKARYRQQSAVGFRAGSLEYKDEEARNHIWKHLLTIGRVLPPSLLAVLDDPQNRILPM
jgi:hypothetical protein